MQEVALLQVTLAFGRAHTDFTLSEAGGGAVATRSGHGGWRTAASKVVMRSGLHFAQFTVVGGRDMMFGVIRPGWDDWDVEGGASAHNVDGQCFYDTAYMYGQRQSFPFDWEG